MEFKKIGSGFGYFEWLRYEQLNHGIIRIYDEIDEDSAERLCSELDYLKRQNGQKGYNNVEEITIRICSGGGGAYFALAMYDAIRALAEDGKRITTFAEGLAASAAAMIVLQAGDKRTASKNTRFLLHETRRWVFFAMERESDLDDTTKELKAVSNQIDSLLSERSGKPVEDIRKLIERKEVWFSAKEALDWGLIDEIV